MEYLSVLFWPMKLAGKIKGSAYRQRDESPVLRVRENGVTAYLVEAKSYEAMPKRLQLLEGLARGEKAIAEGRGVSHSRAKKQLVRWLLD